MMGGATCTSYNVIYYVYIDMNIKKQNKTKQKQNKKKKQFINLFIYFY